MGTVSKPKVLFWVQGAVEFVRSIWVERSIEVTDVAIGVHFSGFDALQAH